MDNLSFLGRAWRASRKVRNNVIFASNQIIHIFYCAIRVPPWKLAGSPSGSAQEAMYLKPIVELTDKIDSWLDARKVWSDNILDNIKNQFTLTDYVRSYTVAVWTFIDQSVRQYARLDFHLIPKIYIKKLEMYVERFKLTDNLISKNIKRLSDEIDSLWRIIKSKTRVGSEDNENIRLLTIKLDEMIRCFNEKKHVKIRNKFEKMLVRLNLNK